jgi:4-coumarate--CoA ligase
MRTGDLGYFDKDGFLYCVDRKKEILKYCGIQISPTEIESVIMQVSGVVAAVVVGVPHKLFVDLPAALVVRSDQNLTSEYIQKFVAGKFSDSKRLRGGVYFVDQLPLTHSGKVKRPEARQIAAELYTEV